jgi:steroid delta-isomerase
MPTTDVIRSAVVAYVEALNKRDLAMFLALFAEQAEQHDPVGEAPRVGRDAIARWWDGAMTGWTYFHITMREAYIVGDEAALVWTIEEHNEGQERSFSGVDVLEFDAEHKIVAVHAYWERRNLPGFV